MQENEIPGWPDAYLVQDEAALAFDSRLLDREAAERLMASALSAGTPLLEWARRMAAQTPEDIERNEEE